MRRQLKHLPLGLHLLIQFQHRPGLREPDPVLQASEPVHPRFLQALPAVSQIARKPCLDKFKSMVLYFYHKNPCAHDTVFLPAKQGKGSGNACITS